LAVEYKYSTFWPRVWAGFIDGLVLAPLSLFDNYLSSPARTAFVLIAWTLFSYSATWGYSVSLHARRGQTVGKKAQHVKVMDVSEERIPSWRQAFLRDIGGIALGFCGVVYLTYLVAVHKYGAAEHLPWPLFVLLFADIGWFFLEITTMLTNSKRRALHDLIAGTVVVRVE